MTRRASGDRAPLVVAMNRKECGILLAALAELPFKTVFALIGSLNGQAHAQFREPSEHGKEKRFEFSVDELSFCARTLESLPYRDVHVLLGRMHRVVAESGG